MPGRFSASLSFRVLMCYFAMGAPRLRCLRAVAGKGAPIRRFVIAKVTKRIKIRVEFSIPLPFEPN